MLPRLTLSILFILVSCFQAQAQYLVFSRSSDSKQIVPSNKIKVHVSPLGLKPRTGILHGSLKIADPLSACTDIQPIDFSNQQDTFLIADDSSCLESVKAKNLAASGAYVGIVKRNINNTLHDRQVDIVHIPILEVESAHYDAIVQYLMENPDQTLSVQADFTQDKQKHKRVNMQLWFSPTEKNAYQFIYEMTSFIQNQEQKINFKPKYVFHSQTSQKQYVGCFSRGRYCPPELEFEGQPSGANVVSESLRQLIISQNRLDDWFRYVNQFSRKCVRDQQDSIWQDQNTVLCSQNVMRSQGINADNIFSQYNSSFMGSRPEVDGNLLLEQERQDYISEKIVHYPIVLVNGKGYSITGNLLSMKLKICNMINPDPYKQTKECQKLTKPPLFTQGQILVGIGILLILMVGVMFVYKFVIHRKMKKQMRGEVDKTLSQYYRYMETLEQPDASTGKVPLMEEKIESNQIGSVELTDVNDGKK